MRQARHIQLEGSVPCGERAIGDDGDLRGGEAGTVYGLGDQGRVEGFPGLRENCSLTLHQIYIRMTNAVQAFEGLLGPFRSKPSNHAVDFDRGLLHLREGWRGGKQASQSDQ
jgi:hypothetical protein